jgi:hypothetical protein
MYDNQIGRFFTQDRYADYYHSLNPYQYTANNPINFVDENGDYIVIFGTESVEGKDVAFSVLYENGKAYHYTKDKDGKITKGEEYKGKNSFVTQAVSDLNSINATSQGNTVVSDLQGSSYAYNVREAASLPLGTKFSFDETKKGGGDIYYYQKGGSLDNVSYDKSYFALGHEIMHAWVSEFTNFSKKLDGAWNYGNRIFKWEKEAVKFENYLRALAGEKDMRLTYNGERLFNWEKKGVDRFKSYNLPIANYMVPEFTYEDRKIARDADNTRVKPPLKPLPMLVDSRKQKL